MNSLRQPAFALILAAVLPGCQLSSAALWTVPDSSAALEIEAVRDVAYADPPDKADSHRRLDLYLPKGKHDYPVVVLVHGGAWTSGDKCQYGLLSSVGKFLAQQGIGAVMPNYRTSPAVKHPEHVRDVAQAVAWTQRHIAEHGGNADRLFLMGHSAGGHLVALLAADETYLREAGLHTADVRGVISVSGVYRIPTESMSVVLGGTTAQAVRIDQFLPLRCETDWNWSAVSAVPILPLRVDAYGAAFADDAKLRADASPLRHVRPGLPPFLIFSAEKDLPTLAAGAEEFHHALIRQGNEARHFRVMKRNHHSILFRAVTPDDPVARLTIDFIRRHAAEDQKLPGTSPPAMSPRNW